jgi:hypothetical protein
MALMVDRICPRCKDPFKARAVDVKRGWGIYCSKTCKAIKQEQRTGQYANYRARAMNPDADDGGEFRFSCTP